MSFFSISFYPVSLFIFLSILSLYLLQERSFVSSGITIALAGATTPLAVVLAVPFIAEFISHKPDKKQDFIRFIAGALLAPIGMLGYLNYFNAVSSASNGISGYFDFQSTGWERTIIWPWQTVFHGLKAALTGENVPVLLFERLRTIQNLGYLFAGLFIAWKGWKNLSRSSEYYLLGGILFLLIVEGPPGNPLMSFPRHLAMLFPIYIGLGLFTGKLASLWKKLLVIVSVIFLVLYTAWFTSGRWVS